MSDPHSRARRAIALMLVLVTVAVYAGVRHHEFLDYDDDEYVTENRAVREGLSLDGVAWAFTSIHSATWHPLTGLSHMLDCELFGLRPGAHLLVNVALHAAATLVLFLALDAMTGALYPSAFVAALFALHPLHVESVAWVSERKDVLSGLFWMLTLWCYARWVRAPSPGRYLLALTVFALGLMAKPMLVTLPFVLLLLDHWPLGRRGLARLVVEKIPFFVLAVAVSVVTFVVQTRVGAVASLESVPFGGRVANALVAYGWYLVKTVWPAGLAVFYPRLPIPAWHVVAAATVLIAVSAIAVREARRHPYLLVGWAWYLGTLIPVLGLVRAGDQAAADRFTYLPLIGIFIVVAWGMPDLLARVRYRRQVLAAGGLAAVAACAIVSTIQVRHWRSSTTLFTHALAVTRDNYVAHHNLAIALERAGRGDEAMPHYLASVSINPDFAKGRVSLGRVLAARGDLDGAESSYAHAVRLDPRSAMAQYNWGLLLAGQGKLDDAIRHYQEALRLSPDYANAHNNLGWALAEQGNLDAAVDHYRAALAIEPGLAAAHNNLAVALESMGKADDALAHYAAAVRFAPANPRARYNLASVLAGAGRADEAIAEYRETVRLAPDLVEARHALAAALADRGRAREAIDEYRAALRARPGWPPAALALAWLLATHDDASLRDPAEAIALAESVDRHGEGDAHTRRTLAAAYAAAARYEDAAAAAERALDRARAYGDGPLVRDLEERLAAYRAAGAGRVGDAR